MQHIERQKLVIIITTVALLILAGIVITVSIFFSSTQTPTPTPTYVPPTASPEPGAGAGEDETAVITSEEGEEDLAPPAGMYANDYSKDEGYTPLPDNFDPEVSPTDETVYNDSYVYFTFNRLMCELSNKKTASEKAVVPLNDFVNDLAFNSSELAVTTKSQAETWITWYTNHAGERVSYNQQEDLNILYCNAQNTDFSEDDHAH